ncbi:hypothetical protein EB241_12325 [Erwinia psidii]|uniref:Uncharacterized protein n=1 Tax=Erwinia psidii TaxID=69224 RepID=A0A3N6RZY2_9GAMM|nr:hypothetical protein EB241_12325 [Erwinia psidii]
MSIKGQHIVRQIQIMIVYDIARFLLNAEFYPLNSISCHTPGLNRLLFFNMQIVLMAKND